MAKVQRKQLSNSTVEKIMSGSGTGSGSSNPSSSPAPKILLAKPGLVNSGGGDDESLQYHRARLPAIGSLNLLSDSWDFHIDRFLPFLTENTDFKVVGVIGPPGFGKSTIMNELYGFDGTSPGMLPPFVIQSEENRAMARHCTTGIEPRISSERLILLDTQPVFSPSVLAEMMRPDGSSTIPVLSGENLSAELALEVMSIQLAVLLLSICHVLLVVSDGVHDDCMWNLLLTADLLKHGMPDPSSLSYAHFQSSNLPAKESKDKASEIEEYMATPVFVHTKLQGEDCSPHNIEKLGRGLAEYFSSSSFMKGGEGKMRLNQQFSSSASNENRNPGSTSLKLFVIPMKYKDDSPRLEYESYIHALQKLRDKVLSMNCSSFARNISEREWLKNSAKIWELVKSSSVIAEYSKMLQSSGMFRR